MISLEEIYRQALSNYSSLGYLMVALARAYGRAPEDVTAYVGRIHGPAFEQLAGLGAMGILRRAALNVVAAGGELQSMSGDDHRAQASLTGLPVEEEAAFFGVSLDDADRYYGSYAPICARAGFSFEWHRVGDEIMFLVEKPVA
jgi:hypothetical protein